MGVLWFARQGIDSTSGFPAYDLPVDIIAVNLGGERNFRFLSPLHSPPITSLGRSEQAVDYRLVLMELDEAEADAANWRAGFYKIAVSPVEVVGKLGEPNATRSGVQSHGKEHAMTHPNGPISMRRSSRTRPRP
jgi:hypothetical protein